MKNEICPSNAMTALLMRVWPRLAPSGVVVALAAVLQAASAGAATLHVSTTGLDSPTCGAQGSPCRNIDQAVKVAAAGDLIKVSAGTYTYANVGNPCGSNFPQIVCVSNKSLTIRGGYTPGTFAFNPGANLTVIDGQNLYRGVYVFTNAGNPIRLTMANFTIQNGRAAGVVAQPGAAGGGMSVEGAAVTLDAVNFLSNQVVGADLGTTGGAAAGSGLAIQEVSSFSSGVSILTGLTFTSNSSIGGSGSQLGGVAFGALFIHAVTARVENSVFTLNTALAGSSPGVGDISGVRADALGGAIGIEGGATVTMSRVTATSNTVTGGAGSSFGGGAFGAGIYAEDSSATITDSLVQSNVAQAANRNPGTGGFAAGGGVLLFNSTAGSIDRTLILANRATGGGSSPASAAGAGGGGGLYLWRGSLAKPDITIPVRNSVLADNVVEYGATGTNPGGGGGGASVQGTTATFDHVTFANNRLGTGLVVGQALVVLQAPGAGNAVANINYSAITNHTIPVGATAVVVLTGNTINFTTGSFSGNSRNTNSDNNPLVPGVITGLASMLALTPSYVSPGSPNFNYHLQAGSQLVDAATGSTVAVDMDAQPRTSPRDIGADEYVSTPCTPGSVTDSDLDDIPDTVEATEGTRPCGKDNDVFASERLFAMQQYRDFLGRESDIDGLLLWEGLIGGGMSRAAVTKNFFDSPEFQGAVAPVTRLYFAYFNRIPDLGGLDYWIAQYRAGLPLSSISQAFAGSPEFIATYGALNNTQFVTLVYNNVLGRAPDSAGLSLWVGQLNANLMTRGQVMVGFSESPEYQLRSYNRVFVTMVYYGMLVRMPDQGGFDLWVGLLGGGTSPLDLINGFLGAPEYRGRFLSN